MRAIIFEEMGAGLPLEQASEALEALRRGEIRGAAVVVPLTQGGEGTPS